LVDEGTSQRRGRRARAVVAKKFLQYLHLHQHRFRIAPLVLAMWPFIIMTPLLRHSMTPTSPPVRLWIAS
jgi:hypothetical protein